VIDSSEVALSFSQTGSGLRIIDGSTLGGFTLAGADGLFYPAEATIRNENSVVVQSAQVPAPSHLRYGWQNNPIDANLGNQERLPASPFEVRLTDD